MRLTNYEFAEDIDKKEWLNSIKMYVGLPYFGGKSTIGRYILNNIFNLAVQMKKDSRKADIFIDAFTGGGKIGLSIPQGWFDTIVINDLNYGVYSYYKCCQDTDKYIALIYMIEKIGKELMNSNFFYLAGYVRSFGYHIEKWKNEETEEKKEYTKENEVADELVAAALTYWVTSASYNNMTAPDTAAYNLTRELNGKEDKAFERANVEKIIKVAYKRIPKLHEKLNNQQYIIENLDYRELIKKYNGLVYKDLDRELLKKYKGKDCKDIKYNDLKQKEQKAESMYINKNKLWYFDPPYHPYCLYGTDEAPYADTFTPKDANEMMNILHGDKEDEYGELDYFIKSDYDPKEVEGIKIKKGEPTLEEVQDLYKKLEEFPFCKICLGKFDKGAIKSTGKKSAGMEYIWCRGFMEGYEDIVGEPAKED